MATRPLAIQKDGSWYCYGWDLTKNICEVFGQNGYIRTAYSYTPYGNVTANGDITQPIQWSSEYADTELALTYYNYRHYNPMDGRWLGRDPIGEVEFKNIYSFLNNTMLLGIDILGLKKLISKLVLNTLIKHATPKGVKELNALIEGLEKANKLGKLFEKHHICPRSIYKKLPSTVNWPDVNDINNLVALPTREGQKFLRDLYAQGYLKKDVLKISKHQGFTQGHREYNKLYPINNIKSARKYNNVNNELRNKFLNGKISLAIVTPIYIDFGNGCCPSMIEINSALDKYIKELKAYRKKLRKYEWDMENHIKVEEFMKYYGCNWGYLSNYDNNAIFFMVDELINPIYVVELGIDLGLKINEPSIDDPPKVPKILEKYLELFTE